MKIDVIIPFLSDNKEKIKINCAMGSENADVNKLVPLNELSKGKFKEWQENQRKKNFNRDYILSLIYKQKGEWLFAGIYKNISVIEKSDGGFTYKTKLLPQGKDFIGRLIVKYKNPRQTYLNFEEQVNVLEICEIMRNTYKFDPFPGFKSVHVEFDVLKRIINEEENGWKMALSSVKGVYLISDKKNGKLYVGKASGENGFWQRWKQYVDGKLEGHGDDKKLKELIDKKGKEYSSNFKFSILEICNSNATETEIVNRETFWKNCLLTFDFGYNFCEKHKISL
ncbi:MAG: GIY-YIG nuclease family protein [Puniceicoccales bacterium]|jgi:hypothetical protein|nr:GIY-YIG nuclease family protein [Puniceicoccales bacterium]